MADKEIGLCKICGKEFRKNNDRHSRCWDCQHPYTMNRNRFVIFNRDGFQCAYCGKKSINGVKLQLDHVVPRALNGDDVASNLITSCKECNLSKSDTRLRNEIEIEYLDEVKRRNDDSGIPQNMNIRKERI